MSENNHTSGVESDDLNTTTIVMVGLISTAMVLASALGVKALFATFVSIDATGKSAAAEKAESAFAEIVAAQDKKLEAPSQQVAGQEDVYTLPIDQAMKLVVDEVSEKQK